jgi:hypothetical protein
MKYPKSAKHLLAVYKSKKKRPRLRTLFLYGFNVINHYKQ